jgi:hypothetical protein
MAGLAFNIDPAGRVLVIPRSRRAATLRLTEPSADVLYPGARPVALSWDAYDTAPEDVDETRDDVWSITPFAGAHAGLALEVHGQYAAACRAIVRATTTPLRRSLLSFTDVTLIDHRIAMLVSIAPGQRRRERATLAALAAVLAARPELRRALSDPSRAARLATDLATGLLPDAPTARASPDDTRILHAFHNVGVFHRFGRPLPGDALPTLDEVVALVHSRLLVEPTGATHRVDDRRIARLARKHYLHVKPWPFTALVS